MYNISRQTLERHGDVIHIEWVENGSYLTPCQALQSALKERKLWKESGAKKVRILVSGQILTPNQAKSWANEEYKFLPKCAWCANMLNEKIYNHQLGRGKFFCSQICADSDYNEEVEKLKDEEPIEYL